MAIRRSSLASAVLAFIALPGLVAFVAPLLLVRSVRLQADGVSLTDSFRLIGLIPLLPGVLLLLWCVRDIYVTGKGTLAPWDPPRHLVASGPYRFSRNPMYIGVSLVLVGWAIGFSSSTLWLYALVVMIAFHIRTVYGEEPWLARAHRKEWERYAARVPRWIFPNRRALLLSIAGVAVALPLAGLLYEAYWESIVEREFRAPGMLVDVGGRNLHLVCIGEGTPTVMFEAGGWGVTSVSSATVRERLSSRTHVCSYDRAGMGWSDPAPGPLTAGALAQDLAVLQDRAQLQAPFVLVGSSVGGITIEMFARQYPERIAGLVFLDAASSANLADLEPWFGSARIGAPVLALTARFGLIRLLDPFRIPTDTDEGRRSAALTYGVNAIGSIGAIASGMSETAREFAAAPPLPADIPLVVLSAADPNYRFTPAGLSDVRARRIPVHQQLAKQSTRGTWQMVPKSEHLIAVSQPEAVIDAVFTLLDELR